ncbi:MAG: nuclear transport factor 2 family protein [Acidimicrobiales bacterium]
MTTTTTTHPSPHDVLVRLYSAVNEGDALGAAALLHPDVVLHVPGEQPLAGDHIGAQGVLAFLTATSEAAERTEQVEVVDVLSGQHHAAAYCLATGRRSDRVELENRTVHLFRIDEGRIVEAWFHNWDQAAVDAFWS